jgi:divalent metal cation (Fe/Co/Zn/Cd) transporter
MVQSWVRREAWSARNTTMFDGPENDMPQEMHRPDVVAALRVSLLSMLWTFVSSVAAVIIGVRSHTSVLVAFGAVGTVDAIGSAALAIHFRHGLRHDRLSERLEDLSHRVVLTGLLLVGTAAVVGGVVRLAIPSTRSSSDLGVALAGVSFVVLLGLSRRKLAVARRIASDALRSDGHLSAVGAVLAAVTLVGTVLERWLHWNWADATATIVLGAVAVWLAITTWYDGRST